METIIVSPDHQMLKLSHEGFDCVCENISQLKPNVGHRWLILCLLDGEVDCIFTSNSSLRKAKADIAKYYSFIYGGHPPYSCVAYIQK